MRNSLPISLFSLFLVLACAPNECLISGTISDTTGTVSLIGDTPSGIIDSCEVRDGKFALKCPRSRELVVAIVRDGNRNDPVVIVPDAKHITVNVSNGGAIVEGSPVTVELQNLQTWAMSTWLDYEEKAMKLIEDGDKAGAKAVTDERYLCIVEHCREVYGKHKHDQAGVQAMHLMMYDMDKDEFLDLFGRNPLLQKDPVISGFAASLQEIKDDGVLLPGSDGEIARTEGSLDDWLGKGSYLLVDFWASWCNPCRQAAPYVEAAFEKYSGKGLQVIGVVCRDKLENTVAAVKEMGLSYPQLLDPDGEIADTYFVTGIPHLILFSPDGEIVADAFEVNEIDSILAKLW